MRIRHKPWARPELEQSPLYVPAPALFRGKWNSVFPSSKSLRLELGCGKGAFLAEMAARYPDIGFLGIDIKSEMLVLAKRKIEEKDLHAKEHVRIFSQDIERIDSVFSIEDQIERIYINFCPPWPKRQDRKHRLTHPKQLEKYKAFLKPDGEIWFKTDDASLFEDSIAYFEQSGYIIRYRTKDLRISGFDNNIETEHEIMFKKEGKPIQFLIAQREKRGAAK